MFLLFNPKSKVFHSAAIMQHYALAYYMFSLYFPTVLMFILKNLPCASSIKTPGHAVFQFCTASWTYSPVLNLLFLKAFRTPLSAQNLFSCCFPEPCPADAAARALSAAQTASAGELRNIRELLPRIHFCLHKNQVLTHVNNSFRATNKQPRCFTVTLFFFFFNK